MTKTRAIKNHEPWSVDRQVLGVKGMLCVMLAFLMETIVTTCAPIGVRTEGVSGPVAWEATDLRLVKRKVSGTPMQLYAFTLVLKETQGTGITFTHIKRHITSLEADVFTSEHTIDWELRPHGELRRPFSYGIRSVGPTARDYRPISVAWTIILTGRDEQNRPVRISININLPSKPPAQPEKQATHPSTAEQLRQPTIVPIQFVRNVILVSATLASKEQATFLLDTGASRTAITPHMARQLGISPTDETPRRMIVVFGGRKIEVPFVALSSIQVGDAVVKNLEVGVAEINPNAPLVDGVLGGDFLGHFKVTVDRAASRLRLDPLSSTSPPAPAHGPPELESAQKRAFEDYLDEHKYPHFKAFVVQVNGTSWGRSWGYNKPEDAIERAIKECRRRASDCQLYAVGRREVYGLSKEELSIVLREYYQETSQLGDLTDIKRRALNSAEIRRLISGRKGEGVLSRSGTRGTIEFMLSGRLVVRVVKSHTRSPRKDEGEWWTDADRLCRRFEKLYSGLSECFYVVEEGGAIAYYDENGALVGSIKFPDKEPSPQPTTVERTAEKPFTQTQEKRLTYIPKELKDAKIPTIELRSTPNRLLESDIEKMIGKHNFYVRNKNEVGYFPNDFVDNADGTVTDRVTVLMWEKNGSSSVMRYWSAKRYVSRLNKQMFSGYNDWRIPTTEELASLLERERSNRGLHIAPVFDDRQKACWSSDIFFMSVHGGLTKNNVINFSEGTIDERISRYWPADEDQCFVRAVRSIKPPHEKPTPKPTTVEQTSEEPITRTQKKRLAYVPKEVKDAKLRTVKLRSRPKPVWESDVEDMIGKHNFFLRHRNETGYFHNDFVDNGDGTVTDRVTGLMWQKGGSPSAMRYWSTKKYVSRLNKQMFAGYNDWRVPTAEELASLLERERNDRGLHIAPIFDGRQKVCWSSDIASQHHSQNTIDFSEGRIDAKITIYPTAGMSAQCFVRAVRSIK